MVDTEDREPTDQDQEDFSAAMKLSAGELIAVATAYMRRLRADTAWDDAMERDDVPAQNEAWETMLDADDDACCALGLHHGVATVAANSSDSAGTVPLRLVSPVADPIDAATAGRN